MKIKTILILLVAMLAMTGCALGETEPDIPVMQETGSGTAETEPVQTEAPIPEDSEIHADPPTVQAMFVHEYTGEYDEYAVSDSPYAEKVVFLTDGAVKEFRLLALTLEDITDDGRISFAVEELYNHGDLTPERGLAVTMNLPETIPYYGISYTDGTGTTRLFSVNLSGRDGSVYLSEIGGAD